MLDIICCHTHAMNKKTLFRIIKKNTVNYYATNDPDIGFSDSLLPLNGRRKKLSH